MSTDESFTWLDWQTLLGAPRQYEEGKPGRLQTLRSTDGMTILEWSLVHRDLAIPGNLQMRSAALGRADGEGRGSFPIWTRAYNLIRWATFRLQKVKKKRESWGILNFLTIFWPTD